MMSSGNGDIASDKVWLSENFRGHFWPSAAEDIGVSLARWHSLIHPDDHDRVVMGLTAAIAGRGRVWWSEHRVRRANGSYLSVYDRATIVYDRDRKTIAGGRYGD